MSTKFIEAKEMKLFDENNRELDRHKGIVNAEKPEQLFDVVSKGYKIAQHQEVVETVEKSLVDLGFKNEMAIEQMGEGGRVHININFLDIKLDVLGTGEYVTMRASLDNSYDSTTGLRLDVGAIKRDIYIYVGEKFSHYYHRHTKSMLVSDLEGSIRHGIETFQTKIKQEFESLAGTKINLLDVGTWLGDCIEKKTISVKYLELIKATYEENSSKINNLWSLYNLICELISQESDSIDRHKQLCQTMLNSMKKKFKKD